MTALFADPPMKNDSPKWFHMMAIDI